MKRAYLGAAIACLLAMASAASARRIPSDTPVILGLSVCTFSAGSCAASDLGVGLYNNYLDSAFTGWDGNSGDVAPGNVYIYDSGIVTLNNPLPPTADLSNPPTLGTAFLAPGLIGSGAYGVSEFLTDSGCEYSPDMCQYGTGIEIVFATGNTLFGVHIQDNSPFGSTSFTNVTVSFDYGDYGDFPAGSGVFYSPTLPSGAKIAYDMGGSTFLERAPSDPGLTDIGGTFDLSIAGSPLTSGAPEPRTWALMLSGLCLVGAALRRQTKARLEAA